MEEKVAIVLEIPAGKYCARFYDNESNIKRLGEPDDTFVRHISLTEQCPLLKICTCSDISLNSKQNSYYCPIANSDTHCDQDDIGILKQNDYYDSICPSLYSEKIMDLIHKNRELENKVSKVG